MSVKTELEELVKWASELSKEKDPEPTKSPTRESWQAVARFLNEASETFAQARDLLGAKVPPPVAAELATDLEGEAEALAFRAHVLSRRARRKPAKPKAAPRGLERVRSYAAPLAAPSPFDASPPDNGTRGVAVSPGNPGAKGGNHPTAVGVGANDQGDIRRAAEGIHRSGPGASVLHRGQITPRAGMGVPVAGQAQVRELRTADVRHGRDRIAQRDRGSAAAIRTGSCGMNDLD